jgi:uncharacterized protein (TIGR00369 family)
MDRNAIWPDPTTLRGIRPRLLGYEIVEVGAGRSRVHWTPTPELANPVGQVHGGFVGLIVDDTCGCAITSLFEDFRQCPTASMSIDYLRPIAIGALYVCRGVVVRAGRAATIVDATIADADGRLAARGTCTFSVELDGSPLKGFTALAPLE